MSKIYEALQLEHKKRTHHEPEREAVIHTLPPAAVTHTLPSAPPITTFEEKGLESEMIGLFYAIESRLSNQKSRILQFVSTQDGEGTSTIVHEFGRVAATELGKSVLLFEAEKHLKPT